MSPCVLLQSRIQIGVEKMTRTRATNGCAVLLVAMAWLTGCAEATNSNACGDGDAVTVNGESYCVYRESVVIVGGFDCPASMPYRIDFQHATVCGNHGFDGVDVPEDVCARVFVPCTEPEPDGGARPCDDGFADCNEISADGCETALNTVTDCGACGVTCSTPNGSSTCERGQCALLACDVGFGDCDADPNNGCETALNTLSNCGVCGAECSGDSVSCASGTCLPTRDNCSSGVFYTTVAECQETGLTCFALANGNTCALCTAALDCTQIDCSDYSPLVGTPPECTEGIGMWEGICGTVRYRSGSGGYTGSTFYWDSATGVLLAVTSSNDVAHFCDDSAFSIVWGDAHVPAGCDEVRDATTSLCPQ